MKSWLKKIFKDNNYQPHIDQGASVIFYPDKIIVLTSNKSGEGIWFDTHNFKILLPDISDEILGVEILEALKKSKYDPIDFKYYREYQKQTLQYLKFKTEKERMRDAKYVRIFRKNDSMSFEPRENRFSDGRQRTFYGMPNDKIAIDPNSQNITIGQIARLAYGKCIIT
jgi:hypothetical protein